MEQLSNLEKVEYQKLTDGFEPSKESNDVGAAPDDASSLCSETMLVTSCRNDVIFALICPQAHIIAKGTCFRKCLWHGKGIAF